MLQGQLHLCYNPERIWRMSEQSLDQRVQSQKRSLSYLWRRQRSWSSLWRCQVRVLGWKEHVVVLGIDGRGLE